MSNVTLQITKYNCEDGFDHVRTIDGTMSYEDAVKKISADVISIFGGSSIVILNDFNNFEVFDTEEDVITGWYKITLVENKN